LQVTLNLEDSFFGVEMLDLLAITSQMTSVNSAVEREHSAFFQKARFHCFIDDFPCLTIRVTKELGPLAVEREVCWLDRFRQQGDESDKPTTGAAGDSVAR